MGIFNRRREASEDDRHRMDVECHHRTLLPRWDRVEDMGHEDLASSYQCSACNEMFSPEQAKELKESAQRTLHETIETTTN
jgi:hypothetical protein